MGNFTSDGELISIVAKRFNTSTFRILLYSKDRIPDYNSLSLQQKKEAWKEVDSDELKTFLESLQPEDFVDFSTSSANDLITVVSQRLGTDPKLVKQYAKTQIPNYGTLNLEQKREVFKSVTPKKFREYFQSLSPEELGSLKIAKALVDQ